MIDLSQVQAGRIGSGTFFSEVFVSALVARFTGGILVRIPEGECGVFFEDGNPIHVGGPALKHDLIGGLLVELEGCPEAAVEAALSLQGASEDKALLGAILVQHGDAEADQVEFAVRHQVTRRVSTMFGLTAGDWEAAPGKNERIGAIGSPVEGWPILLRALLWRAPDVEMRDTSEDLLGKSVRLSGTAEQLEALELDEADRKMVQLLTKPRKPDQLERTVRDRRRVRAFLRALDLCGCLERLPARASVPIPSAVRIPRPSSRRSAPPEPRAVEIPPEAETPSEPPPQNPPSKPPEGAGPDPELIREMKAFHGKIKKADFYELLGVGPATPSREVRLRYTALAKQFHPDKLGSNLPPELDQIARDISAAINDAYSTLDDPDRRKQYDAERKGGSGSSTPNSAGQRESARVKFEMGNVLFKKGDLKRARDYFHFAMANDPDNGMYKAYYAWTIFADRKVSDRREAMLTAHQLIGAAVRENPDDVHVQFYAGKIFASAGEKDKAIKAYEAALKIDGSFRSAASELRQLKLDAPRESNAPGDRGKKKKKKGGITAASLSKLFKR